MPTLIVLLKLKSFKFIKIASQLSIFIVLKD